MVVAGPSHLFRIVGGSLVPTDLARGPWDHRSLHGGAVCGALAWLAASQVTASASASPGGATTAPPGPTGFQLCRLTTEILRPVPLVALGHRASIVHRGRRAAVVATELTVDDRVVARASSQWAVTGPTCRTPTPDPGSIEMAVPRRPAERSDPSNGAIDYPRPGFNCDVFELRNLVGSTEEPGPAVVWARMEVGLIEGVEVDPVQLVATVSDLANAAGWDLSPAGRPMINPDVTLQLGRYPRGEWICLDAATTATTDGIGMMDATLWDGDGRFGRVMSTTVESPVSLLVDD